MPVNSLKVDVHNLIYFRYMYTLHFTYVCSVFTFLYVFIYFVKTMGLLFVCVASSRKCSNLSVLPDLISFRVLINDEQK